MNARTTNSTPTATVTPASPSFCDWKFGNDLDVSASMGTLLHSIGAAILRTLAIFGLVSMLTACGAAPAAAQFTLSGGLNGILGVHMSAGRILRPDPRTTITLGGTFTETLGLEPLIAVTATRPVGVGWNLSLTGSYGGFGGDYRADRLPEVSLTKGDRFLGTPLSYFVNLGFGNYSVRPAGVSGFRLHAATQLNTPVLTLGRIFSTSAAVGYTQYSYDRLAHGGAWGSIQLTAAPSPSISATLTYLRQIPNGSTPLLFDAISHEKYLAASVSFRLFEGLTLSHGQTYSFLTSRITNRVYGGIANLPGGHVVGASWDDVERKVSVSYSRSGFGSLSIFWYP